MGEKSKMYRKLHQVPPQTASSQKRSLSAESSLLPLPLLYEALRVRHFSLFDDKEIEGDCLKMTRPQIHRQARKEGRTGIAK